MAGWGKDFETIVPFFREGVHSSAEGDLIPEDALQHARNVAWMSIGDETAVLRKRRGSRVLNTVAWEGGAIVGQHWYRRLEDSGVYSSYHLVVGEGGSLGLLSSAGNITTYPGVTLDVGVPALLTANNLTFLVNGSEIQAEAQAYSGVKFDGTDWTRIGIIRPDVPTIVPGGAGSMTGEYEVALTYYNENTGHESSRSDSATITLSNQALLVSWSPPPDPQVTHVRVQLRKNTISINFYRAAEIAVGTYSTTLDIDNDAYNALILLSPDTNDNDPPPSGIKYLAWHRGRLFAADDSVLYYSQFALPEGFDPEAFELINPDDGQRITGLFVAHDVLIILKENSTYALIGDGPNDWIIRLISNSIGCVAQASIVSADGLSYWWSERGPVTWDGQLDPTPIGTPFIASDLTAEAINYAKLSLIHGIVDSQQERVFWAVPGAGSSRPNRLYPYHFRLERWEGIWDPFDVASMTVADDTNGTPWIYLGGYNGRVYRFWDADSDGVYSGVVQNSFAGTGTSMAQIPAPGLDTVVGLAGLYAVFIDGSTGEYLGRYRIASNTSNSLTLTTPLVGIFAGQIITVFIGSPDFQVDLRWFDEGRPFWKKRYEYFYLEAKTPGTSNIYADFAYNFDEITLDPRTVAITGGGSTAIWDESLWDVATWSATTPAYRRIRVGRTGRVWRVRLRHHEPNRPLFLLKAGMRGELLTDKR
jgi:hypothetical protein